MKRLWLTLVLLTAVMGTGLFAQARTPVKLPDTIRSAWSKSVKYKVTAPNIFEAKGNLQDMDAIYLRGLAYDGQKNLVIKIRSMSGNFRWDKGKMFGVTLGDPKKGSTFLASPGRNLLDRMIDGPFAVGDEVVFPLPDDVVGKAGPITLVLTIYCGATFEVELFFE
jgi:hypothetical protein